MKTIRHTDTLVYYDGVQVFEGRYPIGGHYVGVMIDSLDNADVYLVTGVAPIQLRQFRSGTLDLKTLLLEGSEYGWYTTHTNDDLMQSLVLDTQVGVGTPGCDRNSSDRGAIGARVENRCGRR